MIRSSALKEWLIDEIPDEIKLDSCSISCYCCYKILTVNVWSDIILSSTPIVCDNVYRKILWILWDLRWVKSLRINISLYEDHPWIRQVLAFANSSGRVRTSTLYLNSGLQCEATTSALNSSSQLCIETSKRTRVVIVILIIRTGSWLFRSSSSNLSPDSRSRRNLSMENFLVRGIEAKNCAALDLRMAKLLNDIHSFLGGIHGVRGWFDIAGCN